MLEAGIGIADITPDLGTHLAGSAMGDRREARSIHDPLQAKALVLACGGKRVCILALDVIVITDEYTAQIRATARRFGLEPGAVLVHTIQTHSAPGIGHLMLDPDFPLDLPPDREYVRGGETPYYEKAVRGAILAIERAAARLVPVQVGYAGSSCPQHACNRRGEETIDPEVSVIGLRQTDGKLLTLLLHYTCHPVTLFCHGMKDPGAGEYHAVSADWPGLWSTAVGAAVGSAAVPLTLNGCCGNINPGPWETIPQWDLGRQVADLTATVLPLVRAMTFSDVATLDWRTRTVELDYRPTPPERLEEVERILAGSAGPKLKAGSTEVAPEWFLAASTRSVAYAQKRWARFPYEVNAIRIGDLAIVGLAGEPFTESQLDLKRRSVARGTMVAHMCSHYVGYVPPRAAYPRFGHEANAKYTYWAKLAPGSAEAVVDAAVEMVGEMF